MLNPSRNEGICYVSRVDVLFVLRKDILLEIVNVVTNRAITFQFAMGATTHIKGHVRSIARTIVIVMSRKVSVRPVPPFT